MHQHILLLKQRLYHLVGGVKYSIDKLEVARVLNPFPEVLGRIK
jgi:hypothetical protein